MTGSFLAKAKNTALLPLAAGTSLLQSGCSPITKNGELSENSLLYIIGALAVTVAYTIFDVARNSAAASRIAAHNAEATKLARLDAEVAANSQPIIIAAPPTQEKAKTLSWVEKPDAKKHPAEAYKSWYDVPAVARTRHDWRGDGQAGKDSPGTPEVFFKTWNEAIGGRRFTNSFGKDSPKLYYKTVADAVAQRNGTPAKILWR